MKDENENTVQLQLQVESELVSSTGQPLFATVPLTLCLAVTSAVTGKDLR